MNKNPYGRVDATRVDLPGQQEEYERANEIQHIMEHGTAEEYDELMRSIGCWDTPSESEGE